VAGQHGPALVGSMTKHVVSGPLNTHRTSGLADYDLNLGPDLLGYQ
jgi:hypothetical protein